MMHGYDQTWRTKTTLHTTGIDECLLHISWCAVSRVIAQAFNGHNMSLNGGGCHNEARTHRFAIHEHRARTALALFTGALGAW